MIIIENTEVLQVLSDAAAITTEPSWSVGYVSASGPTYNQGLSASGSVNGTTAVDMVTGSTGNQMRVMSLSIYNSDTVNRIITVRISTTVILIKALIVAGGSLQYEAGKGWMVHNAGGILQYVGNTGPSGSVAASWESVAQNLYAYDEVVNYASGRVSFIDYAATGGTITKTINYAGDDISSVVLSGAGLPGGTDLTKTLTYSSGNVTAISYT